MGAPVRTQEFYRPLLEDIRRTAVRWNDFDEPRTKGPTLTVDGIAVEE